jgi:23S rRNA (uracil1939-C5)-methyltransferase
MREGELHTVRIDRLGAQGDGLATLEGKPVYVPLALPGEEVQVRLIRSVGGGYQTEAEEILTPSPQRITPPCPHFFRCGGCSVQHLEQRAYLEWKRSVVVENLSRHGLGAAEVRPVLTVSPASRRRLTLAAVARKKGPPVLGFNVRASHEVIEITACPVARPELLRLFPLLQLTLAPWVSSAKALDIALALTDTGVDILVTGPAPDMGAREAAALMLREPSIARLSWRKSEREAPEPMLLVRQPVASFGGIPVALPAGAFLQPSAEGEQCLARSVREALTGVKGRIADLFAGCGTFSFPLAGLGDVLAVEGDEASVTALASATHYQKGVKAEQRDLFRDPLLARELEKFSAVVFDPPRAGAVAQVAELAQSAVPVIAAVSCNLGTFSRDAETLVKGGYRLDWVQPVDQFLWAGHVELVARFSR